MITKEQIEKLVMGKIEGTPIFLVDVKILPGNQIIVHIDKHDGISIEECVSVNHHINANLDRETEDYDLEVSSPGLSSPFKVKEQYLKNTGKDIEVIMKDGRKYNGKLINFSEQGVEIEVLAKDKENKKNKKLVTEIIVVDTKDIKSVRSVVSFK